MNLSRTGRIQTGGLLDSWTAGLMASLLCSIFALAVGWTSIPSLSAN